MQESLLEQAQETGEEGIARMDDIGSTFPRLVQCPKAPPIKSQGIKTRLVPFILGNIKWDGRGRWIEPFLGSGSVLFNARPHRAFVSDTNTVIINLYRAIQTGSL